MTLYASYVIDNDDEDYNNNNNSKKPFIMSLTVYRLLFPEGYTYPR